MFFSEIKTNCRKLIEKIISRRLINFKIHGLRDVEDISKSEPNIKVIFDVGANIGQSAEKFSSAYPHANIFCFEPVKNTFEALSKKVVHNKNVKCYQIALGNKEEDADMFISDFSLTNSLIEPPTYTKREKISLQTLDKFVEVNEIKKIEILKIDAEGFDLEVLKGASINLSKKNIIFIIVEIGFHPGDTEHVLFDNVRDFLMPFGYSLFGIYDQQLAWSGEKRIRYANACFSNLCE